MTDSVSSPPAPNAGSLEFKTCFGCGGLNEHGLHLPLPQFRMEGDEMVVDATIPERFAGWEGIVHGGITATMLDEVCGYYCWRVHEVATVTAELNVRYRAPMRTGVPLQIRASGRREGRNMLVAGRVLDAAGATLAESSVRLVVREDLGPRA